MKYKLIACDMDETFLDDESNIPKRNLEIVKLLDEEYGVKFVPTSGRGQNTLQKEIVSLGFNKVDDEYVIGLNGATVTRANTGELLYFNGLDFDVVRSIFEFGIDKDVCIHIYTSKNLYTYNLNDNEKQFMLEKSIDWIDIEEDIKFLENEPVAKMMYQSSDMKYLEKVRYEMEELISADISYSYSSNRYIEINALSVNKGEGIKELCKIIGITIEEVIAVGDNINDIDMFKVAGLSIAVANSVEEVKGLVDYITKTDNNYGVMEEIFNKFIK